MKMANSQEETQRLIAPPTATATPMATVVALPIPPPIQEVEVEAPATLPEGYGFDAEYQGRTFRVLVPAGGVVKGQRFTAPFRPDDVIQPVAFGTSPPPRGHWRDGLCDCLKFGPLHPSFLNAWLCPQILTAQVMTRMRLDWLGRPTLGEEWRVTFRRVALVLIAYIVASIVLEGSLIEGNPPPLSMVILNDAVGIAFGLYTLVVMIRTRRRVREAYDIPVRRCRGIEDLCCSFWCGCCTVAQLARHTADYEQKSAVCCSKTGLLNENPVLTV